MSFLKKTALYGIVAGLLSAVGFMKLGALGTMAASGPIGLLIAFLLTGAGVSAYHLLVDAVVQHGFLGGKAMEAQHTITASIVSTALLFLFIAPFTHLFAAAGLISGLLSVAAFVAADHLTDEQAKPATK
jgi:hypothetical protein